MISEEKRNEVWERNKPYMETAKDLKETAKDLLPLCRKCGRFVGTQMNFESCRGQACMELWLSNEYLEWCNSL